MCGGGGGDAGCGIRLYEIIKSRTFALAALSIDIYA